MDKEKKVKKNIIEKIKKAKKPKENSKSSSAPPHMHIPNGQLLRGVQIETGRGYSIPLSTDIHTFSTRKRIKEIKS
jgi:hypothetical protein